MAFHLRLASLLLVIVAGVRSANDGTTPTFSVCTASQEPVGELIISKATEETHSSFADYVQGCVPQYYGLRMGTVGSVRL